MSADPHPAHDAQGGPGPTRLAFDEMIQRSGARPVASIEDLDRFQADLWDLEEEQEAFLSNVRASRAADASSGDRLPRRIVVTRPAVRQRRLTAAVGVHDPDAAGLTGQVQRIDDLPAVG